MPLRSPNNPTTDVVVMNAMVPILLGYPTNNTHLATVPASSSGLGPVYVQTEYELFLGKFPALLLTAGKQQFRRVSRSTFMGSLVVLCDYYDRWDQNPATLETVRANIAVDLERMKANIESNPTLAQNNTGYTLDNVQLELSDYSAIERTEQGKTYLYRRLTCHFVVLPYDS